MDDPKKENKISMCLKFFMTTSEKKRDVDQDLGDCVFCLTPQKEP